MGFGFVLARLPLLADAGASAAAQSSSSYLGMAVVFVGVVIQLVALFTHSHSVQRIRGGDELVLRVVSPAYIVGVLLLISGVIVVAYVSATG